MLHNRTELAALAASLLLGLAPGSRTLAAPATSEELQATPPAAANVQPPGRSAATGQTATTTSAGVQQSTTVELLLQLQDRPNVLGPEPSRTNSEPLRRASTTGRTSEASTDDGNPLKDLKNMILGPAAPKNPDLVSQSEPGPAGRPAAPLDQVPAPGRLANDAAADSKPGLLSHPVVRFIRENRVLTIGVSISVLIAIWVTANFSLRRGR